MALISRGIAYTRAFLMVLTSDHISGAGGRTVTGSVGKSAGPWASFSGAVSEVGGGWYIYTYSTGETDTLGDLRVATTATSCDPTDFVDQVVGFNPGNTVNLGLTALPQVTAGTAGGVPTAVGGNAVGMDWSNVRTPSTAVSLSATDIRSVTQGMTVVNVAANAISTDSFAANTTLYGVTTVTTGMAAVAVQSGAISTASFAAGSVLYGVTTVTQGMTVVNVAADAIASRSAATAFFNRIIDIAARRQYTNIRSSSEGETPVRWSLMGAIARLVNRTDFQVQPATIYHEDGSTSFFTETMTTATTADAVVQLT